MTPDHLSAALRGVAFVALMQTAGGALFASLFGRHLVRSRESLERIVRLCAGAAVLTLSSQYLLEAARMADDLSGVLNADLQALALHSAISVVLLLRLLGCAVLVASFGVRSGVRGAFVALGLSAMVGSFALTGHTVSSHSRGLLSALLMVHVVIAAFWFGALVPLYVAAGRETAVHAAALTREFSRIAVWIVPLLLIAGGSLAVALVQHASNLATPYGYCLIGKFLGFAFVMSVAALNKWRFGPALASGGRGAVTAFRAMLVLEFAVLSAVLGITATMTLLYSPAE